MKLSTYLRFGLLAAAGWTGTALGQTPPSWSPAIPLIPNQCQPALPPQCQPAVPQLHPGSPPPLSAPPVSPGQTPPPPLSAPPVQPGQTPPTASPQPAQPGPAVAPTPAPSAVDPSTAQPSTAPSAPPQTAPQANDYSRLGQELGGTSVGNFSAAGAGASAGVSSTAGTASGDAINPNAAGQFPTVSINSTTRTSTPLILPGLFTASQTQSALPVDRVFFNYGYTGGFRVGPTIATTTVGAPIVTSPPGSFFINMATNVQGPLTAANIKLLNLPANLQPGTQTTIIAPTRSAFNLNMYMAGIEKTFLDGRAAIYANIPVLDATGNSSGQPINGLGDVSAGLKFVLFGNPATGSVLTSGMTVSAPTGRDSIISVTTSSQNSLGIPFNNAVQNPPGIVNLLVAPTTTGAPTVQITRINPTYLQPYTVGLWSRDRFFIQDYFGAIIPTDSRIPVYLNESLTAGYQVYEGTNNSLLTAVTPFVGAQALITASGSSFSFPDQVFLSTGASIGLGQRLWLSGSYVTPVAGPRAFNGGFNIGLNLLY